MNARTRALMNMKSKVEYKQKVGTKGRALEYFKAKVNKKKLPDIESKPKEKTPYKKLTIEEYEAKYK